MATETPTVYHADIDMDAHTGAAAWKPSVEHVPSTTLNNSAVDAVPVPASGHTLDATPATAEEVITKAKLRGADKTGIMCTSSLHGADAPRLLHDMKFGLISVIETAYSGHHGLVLRPDDVWLQVTRGFSWYFQSRAEAFRGRLVSHKEGKTNLRVDITKPFDQTQIERALAFLVEGVRTNTSGDFVDWLLPAFSTTTTADRAAAAITTMATAQAFFSYEIHTKCGIPYVRLEGTNKDWTDLCAKVEGLVAWDLDLPEPETLPNPSHLTYGTPEYVTASEAYKAASAAHRDWVANHKVMSKWVSMLRPVVRQMMLTARGEGDMTWWNSAIWRSSGSSGSGETITGWTAALAPFNPDGKFCAWAKGDGMPAVQVKDLGAPVVDAPVAMTGAFVGKGTMHAGQCMAQVVDGGLALAPRTDWALTVVKE